TSRCRDLGLPKRSYPQIKGAPPSHERAMPATKPGALSGHTDQAHLERDRARFAARPDPPARADGAAQHVRLDPAQVVALVDAARARGGRIEGSPGAQPLALDTRAISAIDDVGEERPTLAVQRDVARRDHD